MRVVAGSYAGRVADIQCDPLHLAGSPASLARRAARASSTGGCVTRISLTETRRSKRRSRAVMPPTRSARRRLRRAESRKNSRFASRINGLLAIGDRGRVVDHRYDTAASEAAGSGEGRRERPREGHVGSPTGRTVAVDSLRQGAIRRSGERKPVEQLGVAPERPVAYGGSATRSRSNSSVILPAPA